MTMALREAAPAPSRTWATKLFGRDASGYLFLTPWLVGIFGLTIGPALVSLYLSFTRFDLITDPQFVGLANYKRIFFSDAKFLRGDEGDVHLRPARSAAEARVRAGRRDGAQQGHRGPDRSIGRLFYLPSLLGAQRRHRGAVAEALRRRRTGQRHARACSASRGRAGSRTPTTRSTRWWCWHLAVRLADDHLPRRACARSRSTVRGRQSGRRQRSAGSSGRSRCRC